MFTGVVYGLGTVKTVEKKARGARLVIEAPSGFPAVKIGGSVSVNGACLTVVRKEKKRLVFDVVRETMRCTRFGGLKPGDRVHLEPALAWNGRLEGHFVQGHVDGTGRVRRLRREKKGMSVEIAFPPGFRRYVLEKGSVAVDGVSLTVGKTGKSAFWVHLIPHTLKRTGFGGLRAGDRVNLEGDMLLKFFRSL